MPPNNEFEQRWRERFCKFGTKKNDDAGIAGWSPTGLEARSRHFADHWKPNAPGSLWLDAGCGAGTYTRSLVQSGLRAVGLDYSQPSLIKAKSKSRESILFAVADVHHLPVKSNSVDGVLCFGVSQALSESKPACLELMRVVRPGAQVWFDGLNRWSLPHLYEAWNRKLRGRPVHLRHEDPFRVRNLFRKNKMAEIRLLWLPIFPARLAKLQWLLETDAGKWLFRNLPLLGPLFSHSFVVVGEKTK